MPDIRRIVILIKAPCLMRLRFYLNGHKPVKTQSGHLETALSPQGLAFRPPCGSPPYNKERVLMAVPSGQEIAGVIIVVACTIFGLIMFLRAAKAEQEERKFEDYKLWDRL